MKQFLRHIFLLLALFMATSNAWAECVIINDGGTYTIQNGWSTKTTKSFDISSPKPADKLTFNFSKASLGVGGVTVKATYSDGSSEEVIKRSTSSNQSYTFPNKIVKKLEFYADGSTEPTLKKEIKNIKLTQASYANAPTPSSLTFDTKMVNSSEQTKTFTISWSDVNPFTFSLSGSDQFSYSFDPNTNAQTCSYGTMSISVTYKYTSACPIVNGQVQPHTATLTVTTSKGDHKIPLTGTTLDKYDADFNWNIANEYYVGYNTTLADAYTLTNKTTDNAISLPLTFTIKTNSRSSIYQEDGDGNYDNDVLSIEGEELKAKNAGVATITASFAGNSEYKPFTKELTLTINKHDVNAFIIKSNAFWNEKIENAFYLSDDFAPFTVGPSSDTKIATYDANANQIQTYFTSGTVTFQISRPENYKYKELKPTSLTLDVGKNDELSCFIVTDEECDIINTEGAVSKFISLNGALGDVLTFKYRINSGTIDATWMHYITPLYSTNGSNFNPILKEDGSEYRFETKWLDDPDESAKVPLPQGTTHIQFKRTSNNSWGDRSVKISDIDITRKAQLEPQIEDDKFYLSQSSSGMNFSGSFILNWSTCASEIRLVCENPLFEISHTIIDASSGNGSVQIDVEANMRNASALTGELTIYDQSQKKIITLSCEHLLQRIVWDQHFYNIEVDNVDNIDQIYQLEAEAQTLDGTPTNRPISYSLDANAQKFAYITTTQDGLSYLHITAKGEGTITAYVDEYVAANGKTYSADQITHEIRVRKAGEPCKTIHHLSDRIELNFNSFTGNEFYVGDKNPDTIMYKGHRDILGANYFYVQYSKDAGATWNDIENPMLPEETDANFKHAVPEGATHVRFVVKSNATLRKYIKDIRVSQKSYLRTEQTPINTTVIVNTPFSQEIEIQYSDIPYIQSELVNKTPGLTLMAKQPIDNTCGVNQFGTYTFTLSGEWAMPQEINETVRFFTSAGDEKTVQVNIVVKTAETVTSVQNGSWNDANTWSNQTIPNATNPVEILHPVTITDQAQAHSITVQGGGYVHIASTGGLTVHAGGYTPLNKNEEDLEITINNDHAGYFRMSPLAKTDMPKAKVNFTTRGQLNQGGNSADWQYIGAPGEGAATDILGTTVLYLRSEEKGWVRLKTFWAELEAFAGYALTQKAQPEFIFYPQLINEDKTIQLTYTSDGMQGDNLWANSYMAPLDITQFNDADFTGDIEKTFYLYNSGSWDDWNKNQDATSSSTFTPGRYYAIPVASARALDATYDQNVIPPMQGVYMKATSGGGTIKLNYEKHVWKNTQVAQMNNPLRIAGRKESAEEQKPDFQRVRLQVTSENSGADRMYIIQDSLTTSGYDNGYDAPKQMADNLMNIYTNEPFGKMEISSTNNMDGMYIGFKAGDDSEYTMTFTSLIGDSLYLYDSEMDTYVEMIELGQYQFSAIPQSTNDMRFQLLVAPEFPSDLPEQGGGVATSTEDITSTRLWVNDRTIYVANVQPNSVLSIYTVSGMLVTAPYTLHSTQSTINIADLPAGVYIIRLNDLACKFVCK